jgi:hypothetical protein
LLQLRVLVPRGGTQLHRQQRQVPQSNIQVWSAQRVAIAVLLLLTEGQHARSRFITNVERVAWVIVEASKGMPRRSTGLLAIVCGSLHQHKYQASLLRFLEDNRAWLVGLPAAFVAVSLSAALKDNESRDELQAIAEAFYRETGWTPAITRHVAGALRYTQYDYFKRLI